MANDNDSRMTGDNDDHNLLSPVEERILLTMAAKREGDFERFSGIEAEAAYRLFGGDGGASFVHAGHEQDIECQAFRLADGEDADVLVLRTNTGGKA